MAPGSHGGAGGGPGACPVKYGFCSCGLLQVGRPYHGDSVKIVGAAAPRCAHEEYYEQHPSAAPASCRRLGPSRREPRGVDRFNPMAYGACPELMECGAGNMICLLTNPWDYYAGAAPIWEKGMIVSTSSDAGQDP